MADDGQLTINDATVLVAACEGIFEEQKIRELALSAVSAAFNALSRLTRNGERRPMARANDRSWKVI